MSTDSLAGHDAPGRPPAVLTVGDVAAECGAAPSAVRFYEKHGLIHAERTAGNQRRFSAMAPCKIKIARVAQRVGLTVREIAVILDRLPEDPGLDDFQLLEDTLIAEAEARVEALKATLVALDDGSKLCEVELPDVEPR